MAVQLFTCVSVTVVLKRVGESSSWVARKTASCTNSRVAHSEIVLTVVCPRVGAAPGASCSSCAFLEKNLPETKAARPSAALDATRGGIYHLLSYSITGNSGRDKVFEIVNRKYPAVDAKDSIDNSTYEYYTRTIRTHEEETRVQRFLLNQLGKPFSWKQFYLNKTLCCCAPDCALFGPQYEPSHVYDAYDGGWTCSSLCLAAVQFMGVLPHMSPGKCTPADLQRFLSDSTRSDVHGFVATGPPGTTRIACRLLAPVPEAKRFNRHGRSKRRKHKRRHRHGALHLSAFPEDGSVRLELPPR